METDSFCGGKFHTNLIAIQKRSIIARSKPLICMAEVRPHAGVITFVRSAVMVYAAYYRHQYNIA